MKKLQVLEEIAFRLWLLVSALLMIGVAIVRMRPVIDNPIAVEPPTANAIEALKTNIRMDIERKFQEKRYEKAAIIARLVYRHNHINPALAELTGRVAVDTGISPRILAALVFVESSGRANALSPDRRSVGLTQVNTRVWHYTQAQLLKPEANLRIGASILAAYVHRYGLLEGLHHYNGLGNPTNEYALHVLAVAGA